MQQIKFFLAIIFVSNYNHGMDINPPPQDPWNDSTLDKVLLGLITIMIVGLWMGWDWLMG